MKEIKTISEVTESFEDQHSVKFSLNKNGEFSAEVKVYGKTPDEALKECARITAQVEMIIKEKNKR